MVTGRPLRIGLVSAYFRPHVGGVERFTETLARALAGGGHDVLVLTCRTEPDTPLVEEVDGYRIRRVAATNVLERRLRVPFPLPHAWQLRRCVAAEIGSLDVVHAHEARYFTTMASLRAARGAHVPSVLTQHTGFVPQWHPILDLMQRLMVVAARESARSATVVACHNPQVAEWAGRAWGIERIRLLPIGVAATAQAPSREEFGLPHDRFLVLFVGRNVRAKGLDVLLEALDPAYDVVAVTDARAASRPGLHVLPFMSPERLDRLRASVDAFVLPSRAEGFPLVLQEAMAAGLPVVTTMLPGFDHSIDASDVLVIEPSVDSIRHALGTLADDPALRARLAASSREAAERRFGLERFVDAYEELYASLLEGAE